MQFSVFSSYLQQLESISSRLKMTEILAELLVKLEEKEIIQACYLMQGKLVPLYESLEFGLSEKMIIRALARLVRAQQRDQHNSANQSANHNLFGEEDLSVDEAKVKKIYKRLGDIGLAAEEIVKSQSVIHHHDDHLNILNVFESLTIIAHESGEGSQDRKISGLVQLIKVLDSTSVKFVTRIILGKMRLGFSQMTMLDALSWAVMGDKSEHEVLEEAYNRKADIGKLAQFYLSLHRQPPASRAKKLLTIKAEVGVPIIPALCQRLNSAEEIISKMGEIFVEPKYDGMRVQIHFNRAGKKISVFTRNMENVSHMFPELQQLFSILTCQSCIFDAEAIGYNKQTGQLLNFQETITRRRKHRVAETAAEIPMRFYVFDILELNNQTLIDEPLFQRKAQLKDTIPTHNPVLYVTPFIITTQIEEWQQYHSSQLGSGLEGVVSKQISSLYHGGRKGWHWVKTKEEEGTSGKLADTLDLVVMGYFKGTGKRTEFEIGALLCGVVDDQGQILTISKVGSGLSEENSQVLLKTIKKLMVKNQPSFYRVNKNMVPDIWVEPKLVVEVAADEITTSPIHTAKKALRFPRFLQIRIDKTWEQATSLSEINQWQ